MVAIGKIVWYNEDRSRKESGMIRLGQTELTVSEIGLGADHFGTAISDADASYFLDAFCDMGGNLIDTANVYGKWVKNAGNASERFLGRWLKQSRKPVIIATKGGHYDLDTPSVMRLSPKEVEKDLDESLRTLGLDCLDFYWLHRDDPCREIGEILEMMEGFVKAGKIRYYGASNYTAPRMIEAKAYATAHGITGFSALSNRFSLLKENPVREHDTTLAGVSRELLCFLDKTALPLIPYQATGRGYLVKRHEGRTGEDLDARYRNPENEALYRRLLADSEATGGSLQARLLIETVKAFSFPMIPLTSVRKREHLEDLRYALTTLQQTGGTV